MRFSMITLGGLLLAAATPAMAQDDAAAPADTAAPADPVTVSGGITGITDYRFRGITQTNEHPAVQATVNVNHESGFYAGIWTSSIRGDSTVAVAGFGQAEVDLYGGWTKTFKNGVGVDVGLLYYLYPIDKVSGLDTDFFEPYASVSYTVGPVTAKVGGNYSWGGQSALAGNDSLYLRADVTATIPKTPVTVLGHIGHTDGQLGLLALTSDNYTDWSLGLEVAGGPAKIGVQYVDTDITKTTLPIIGAWDKAIGADATVLAYLTVSF